MSEHKLNAHREFSVGEEQGPKPLASMSAQSTLHRAGQQAEAGSKTISLPKCRIHLRVYPLELHDIRRSASCHIAHQLHMQRQ